MSTEKNKCVWTTDCERHSELECQFMDEGREGYEAVRDEFVKRLAVSIAGKAASHARALGNFRGVCITTPWTPVDCREFARRLVEDVERRAEAVIVETTASTGPRGCPTNSTKISA